MATGNHKQLWSKSHDIQVGCVVIADDRLVSCNYAAPADCHLLAFANNNNKI